MQPKTKMGSGTASPEPKCIAFLANALSTYPRTATDSNMNEQWLTVPRSVVELAIDIAIDWLDLTDRLRDETNSKAEAPENAP